MVLNYAQGTRIPGTDHLSQENVHLKGFSILLTNKFDK